MVLHRGLKVVIMSRSVLWLCDSTATNSRLRNASPRLMAVKAVEMD